MKANKKYEQILIGSIKYLNFFNVAKFLIIHAELLLSP